MADRLRVGQEVEATTKAGTKTVEVVRLITSATSHHPPPPVLASWIRGRWAIENRLHWQRDVTWDQDRSAVRTGTSPRVIASRRNTAIGICRSVGHASVATALRHYARRPDNTIT